MHVDISKDQSDNNRLNDRKWDDGDGIVRSSVHRVSFVRTVINATRYSSFAPNVLYAYKAPTNECIYRRISYVTKESINRILVTCGTRLFHDLYAVLTILLYLYFLTQCYRSDIADIA